MGTGYPDLQRQGARFKLASTGSVGQPEEACEGLHMVLGTGSVLRPSDLSSLSWNELVSDWIVLTPGPRGSCWEPTSLRRKHCRHCWA